MTSFHVWAFARALTESLLWQPHKKIALETNLFQNFSGFSSFVQDQMFMTPSYLAHLFLEHEPRKEQFIWEAITSKYREKPAHTDVFSGCSKRKGCKHICLHLRKREFSVNMLKLLSTSGLQPT